VPRLEIDRSTVEKNNRDVFLVTKGETVPAAFSGAPFDNKSADWCLGHVFSAHLNIEKYFP